MIGVPVKPRALTVLIPFRNAERTLSQTLDSLAAQTYRDFEILLVNDASTDGSAYVARQYRERLPLEVLSLPENAGVAGALNVGLSQITTPYIARLDADDIALPTRLEKQVDFLRAHANVDVCSTWIEVFFDHGERTPYILAKPLSDAAIRTAFIQYCAVSHTASTFRKSFFSDVGAFDTNLDFAEDYDLWCRGSLLGKTYVNLPDALTRYRQHANQVGTQKYRLQQARDLEIKRKYISALLGHESPGLLPEFFSLVTEFTSEEVAARVLAQSFPLLLRLGQKVADEELYARIVSGCIERHLAIASMGSA